MPKRGAGRKKNKQKKEANTANSAPNAAAALAEARAIDMKPSLLLSLPSDVIRIILFYIPARPRRLVVRHVCKRLSSVCTLIDDVMKLQGETHGGHPLTPVLDFDMPRLEQLLNAPPSREIDVRVRQTSRPEAIPFFQRNAPHWTSLKLRFLFSATVSYTTSFLPYLQNEFYAPLLTSLTVAYASVLPADAIIRHASQLTSLSVREARELVHVDMGEEQFARVAAAKFTRLRSLAIDIRDCTDVTLSRLLQSAPKECHISLRLHPPHLSLLISDNVVIPALVSRLLVPDRPKNLEVFTSAILKCTRLTSLQPEFDLTASALALLANTPQRTSLSKLIYSVPKGDVIESLMDLTAYTNLTSLEMRHTGLIPTSVFLLPYLRMLCLEGLFPRPFPNALPILSALLSRLPQLTHLTLGFDLRQLKYDEKPWRVKEFDAFANYLFYISPRYPKLETIVVPAWLYEGLTKRDFNFRALAWMQVKPPPHVAPQPAQYFN